MSISVNEELLEPFTAFPHLGHRVAYNNSESAVLYQNFWKSWRWWGVLGKVVTKMGKTVQARGMFYKEIV